MPYSSTDTSTILSTFLSADSISFVTAKQPTVRVAVESALVFSFNETKQAALLSSFMPAVDATFFFSVYLSDDATVCVTFQSTHTSSFDAAFLSSFNTAFYSTHYTALAATVNSAFSSTFISSVLSTHYTALEATF